MSVPPAPMSIKRSVAPPPVAEVEVEAAPAVAADDSLLASFRALPVLDQAAFLRQAQALHEKAVKQALKEAVKEGKAARRQKKEKDPNAPKREQSESVKAWLAYVQVVHAEMKESNPDSKYGDAMIEASRRRDAGDPAAPAKAEPKAKKGLSDEEKAAKAAAKAEKKAAKEAEKQSKLASKEAEKEAKAAAKAEKKEAKEAEKAAKAAAKEAATAAKEAAKEKAKQEAAAKAAAKAKPSGSSSAAKPAAAPAPAPAAQEEEQDLMPWTHKGVNYWRSAANECWLRTADNQLGKWAGRFDAAKDKIVPAVEPKLA